MLTRLKIEAILSAELEAVMKRHREATEEFKSVIDSVPSGIPAPDGVLRVQIAGKEKRAAMEALRKSLVRFNGFILNGFVPDDLIVPDDLKDR